MRWVHIKSFWTPKVDSILKLSNCYVTTRTTHFPHEGPNVHPGVGDRPWNLARVFYEPLPRRCRLFIFLFSPEFLDHLRPMTMETRCSRVIFPNYKKKRNRLKDTLVPPLWGTREKKVCFSRIICSRCCTRRNMRFHVENCQHADRKQLTRR